WFGLIKTQTEGAPEDEEHSIERLLKRKKIPQRFLIKGKFLPVQLICVVTPVPNVDARFGIARFQSLHFLELPQFRFKLWLNARYELADVGPCADGSLSHPQFRLIICPGFVPKLQRDPVAYGQHFINQRHILLLCERIMGHVKTLARGFAASAIFDDVVLPHRVRHYSVMIVVYPDSGRREEVLRYAIELSFSENNRRFCADQIALKLGGNLRELTAKLLDLLALMGRRFHSRASKLAQRRGQKPAVLASQLRLFRSECLDRVENIFAIVEADVPLLELLPCAIGGCPHERIWMSLADQSDAICDDARFRPQIFQRCHRVLESNMIQIL